MKRVFVCCCLAWATAFSVQAQKAERLTAVNTADYYEFAVAVTEKGDYMIFESNQQEGNWRLFESKRKGKTWSKPAYITAINEAEGFSENDFVGGPCFTGDGKTLYFTSDRPDGMGGIDIWMSTRKGNSWTAPSNLGSPINTAGYDAFPSVTPDGKTMYFIRDVADIQEGMGDEEEYPTSCNQIYVSYKDEDGEWSEPQRLPAPFGGCEDYPRIMPDGKTLVFSKSTDGGLDLFKSVMKSKGRWSDFEALDELNTLNDEHLLNLVEGGKTIYYSAYSEEEAEETENTGFDDIYIVKKQNIIKVNK